MKLTSVSLALVCAGASISGCVCDDVSEPSTVTTGKLVQERERPPAEGAAVATVAQLDVNCPMQVEGVKVTSENTDEGMVLVFRTDAGADEAEQLYTRAQHLAQLYGMHEERRHMYRWSQADDRQGGDTHQRMPQLNVGVEKLDDGALLRFAPANPSELEQLREQVRLHQQRMQGGDCWLMDESGQ